MANKAEKFIDKARIDILEKEGCNVDLHFLLVLAVEEKFGIYRYGNTPDEVWRAFTIPPEYKNAIMARTGKRVY